MSGSLLQTLIGFVVVNIGMILLTGIIVLFSKVMAKSGKKEIQAIEEEKPVEHVLTVSDQSEEVIAAIMACVQAYIQQNGIKSACNIVIRPAVRTSVSAAWSNAGRMENVSRRV